MTSKTSKRLAKAKRNPRDIRFDELLALYREFGFAIREGKGSHYVVSRRSIIRTLKRSDPVKPEYVKQAVEAIEESLAFGTSE